MALVVGTNSYISVADAATYLADRLFTDAWTNASDTDKAAALIMATRVIERQPLLGKPADVAQALNFPRCYPPSLAFRLIVPSRFYANPMTSYDGPLQLDRTFGYGYPQQWVCETDVPQAVLDAVCEEALALLDRGNSDRRQLQFEGVTSVRLGDTSESYATSHTGRAAKPDEFVSPEARGYLRPYIARAVRIR